MTYPFKKESAPDFSDPKVQENFINEPGSPEDLLRKDLDVNQAQQELLVKRIELMRGFINDIPSSDPHYSMLLSQVQMDQIELDELKRRAQALAEKIEKKQ